MRILLLGDYSAVHKNLKEGLLELGLDVKLASNGDWWKKIPGRDFPLTIEGIGNKLVINRYMRKYYREIQPLLNSKFYGYDVVQAMTADLFDMKIRMKMYKRIFERNKDVFCLLPGDDYYTYRAWKAGKFRYSSFDDNDERIHIMTGDANAQKLKEEAYDYMLEHSKGIIPINPYELEMPYYGMKNLRRYIPFPINIHKISYQSNVVNNGKIVIYHSITRPRDKGSDYIARAMEYIQNKYPNDVECIIRGMVPYREWLELMKKANVIVDQCKSYSYGMTAALAMASGKVVLSGLEPETLTSIQTPGCPIYNIVPNTDQIVSVLENMIENKNNIESIGYRGRRFVETEHDYIKVAKMYLEEWRR